MIYQVYTVECGNRVERLYALSKRDAIKAYRRDNQNMGNAKVVDFENIGCIDISLPMSEAFYDKYEPLIENHEDKIHI